MRHEISDIKFEPVENDPKGLLGFVSFVIDGFAFTGLAIFSRLEGGIRISWPERQRGIKRIRSAQPVSQRSFSLIESHIFAAIQSEIKK